MKTETEQRILDIATSPGGYVHTKTFLEAGVHPNHIAALVAVGKIVRLKRGFYALPKEGLRSELVDIQRAVPGSVVCLGSALSILGIGSWEPPEVHLAIWRDRRIRMPDSPPIHLFSFSGERFELGVEKHSIGTDTILVYDREKTICDILHFRNALGHDIAMEALREYLQSRDKDIPKLIKYAKLLRMEGTVKKYLEALV